MDIKEVILQEHSKKQAMKIVRYIGSDRARFQHLIDVFLRGPYRVTQRAAWPLSLCVEMHPPLVMPHLGKLLRHLRKPGLHNAVTRNTMRLFQFIEIPQRFHGEMASLCFKYLQDNKQPVAIRAFSMRLLGNLCRHNPGLGRELRIIVEGELPFAKPAFVSMANRVLKEISANGGD